MESGVQLTERRIKKMSKTYWYGCDGGSILIGNESSRTQITNDYGDGEHKVIVCSEGEYNTKGFDFRGTVGGTDVNVYDYDCLHGDDLNNPEHILCKLKSGHRYAVSVCNGTILLEDWGEY